MSRNNVVLISEYNMPEPHFVEVERWEYVNTLHRTQRKALIDKVFMVRGGRGAPS